MESFGLTVRRYFLFRLPPSPPHHAFAKGEDGVPTSILSSTVTSSQSHHYFFMLRRPRFLYTSQGICFACLLAFIKTLRLHPGGAESGAPMQGTGTCIWVLPEKRQKKDNCNSQSDSLLRAWPVGKSSRRGVNCPNKLKIWRKQRTTFPPSIPHAQQTHRIQGTGLFRKSKEYFLSY